ncbi:hypothetical protein [Lewinella sp. W8]|uniref:hypothetical protein n=1 Tax=Lewinella sp. W8 TaxID=2528208 RepID=UPI00106807D5|nr:hypothetical protein [Lewinella sp. W8]MTB51283.1 hypothetical protein [Lewinella sp. W8]
MTLKFWWRIPLPLLFCQLLCTCGDDTSTHNFDPTGRTFAYDPSNAVTEDLPFYLQPLQLGDRLTFGPDSVIITNVFSHRLDTFPLRNPVLEDTAQLTLDYELAPDSSLRISLWAADERVSSRWFAPHTDTDQPLRIDEWVGNTYALPGEDTRSRRVYFGHHSWRDGKTIREQYVAQVLPTYTAESSLALVERPEGYAEYGFLMLEPHPVLRYLDGVTGANFNFQLGRNAEGDPYLAYRTEDGERVFSQVLQPLESVVPHYVDEAKLAERLNRGRIVVDRGFSVTEATGISFNYEKDFIRRGGLTLQELDRLEFFFDPQSHDYNFFVGDRAIKSGKWALSGDRNYLILSEEESPRQTLLPLVSFDEEEIAFRIRLRVKTPEPRGKELLSYFDLDALIRVRES